MSANAAPLEPESMTLPRLLFAHAAERPRATALSEKRYGIWQGLSWCEYAARVTDVARGLATLGVERGDVVGVLGDNRPEWLIAELAAQCLGALVVGIHPTSVGDEIVHIFSLARVNVVVAEDQEQVDKLLGVRAQLPRLSRIVYYDPRGLERYSEPDLLPFLELEAAGRAHAGAQPNWLQQRVSRGRPEDPALVCTTSGTTARPKLAVLSHANLLYMGRRLQQMDPLDANCRYVSFLPLAWVGEQVLAVACGLLYGFCLSFPEAAGTQRMDLREIGPDLMLGTPHIWESLLSEVQIRIDQAGWLERALFGWAYQVGDQVAALHLRGTRPGPGLRAKRWLADVLGLRPLRDQLGLLRLRRCYTGGAPLSPEAFRFFRAIGVNLEPIEDAWLHTGDAGYLDGDHLIAIDRRSEALEQRDGSELSRSSQP